MDLSKKKIGTREEVYKGLAIRTAGGLQHDDIIEKQFGTRVLYISKKLSDKIRNNPIYLKRINKRTLNATTNTDMNNVNMNNKQKVNKIFNTKTQKLSFRVKDNTIKNIYYPELQGINIQQLKNDLMKEEAEEDKGIILPLKEFNIEQMPDIDIEHLE